MTPLNGAIGRLVWTQLWQVTLVAAVVAVATRLICRRRPHLAHTLWLLVLVKCLAPPLWSSPTGVFCWAAARPSATMPAGPGVAVPPRETRPVPAARTEPGEVIVPRLAAPRGESADAGPARITARPDRGAPSTWLDAAAVLGIVWLAGALAYGVVVLLATVRWWRTTRRGWVPVDEPLTGLAVQLARRLGLRRRVRLVVSTGPLGPLTCGWIRPVVVLPRALTASCSLDELEPLLAHELVHVRRGDALVALVQVAAQALWWFHPLVWWANRQITAERERCCDEEVVAGLGYPPGRYARSLLSVLELKRRWEWLGAFPGVRSFEVTRRRLEHVMLGSGRFRKRMPRGYWMMLAVGALVVVPGDVLRGSSDDLASAPKEQQPEDRPEKKTAAPAPKAVSASALMQGVYDGLAWIDSARSFRIRTLYRISQTEEDRRHEAEHPPLGFRGGGKSDPRPFLLDTVWAWDPTRICRLERSRYEGETEPMQQTRIWDGSLGVEAGESADHQDRSYVLGNKHTTFFDEHQVSRQLLLPWGPGGAHHFWWLPTDVVADRKDRSVAPEDFELEGQDAVNGRRCHVLLSRAGKYRMHVGVADGRLYRRTWLLPFARDPRYNQLALLKKVGGPAIKSARDWQTWLAGLKPDERRRAYREFELAEFEFTRVSFHQTFDDYREVAPGCWMAFRQIVDSYNLEVPEPFLASHTEQTVTEVSVNKPLPDELFRIELADGVPVTTDWRYDPIIRYTYRKDQTEAERVALCEAERATQKKWAEEMKKREAIVEARMGQAPPPLPDTGWLGGGPMTWKQLRGKVVVLHFWEVNCGPCDEELPFVANLHERAEANDLVVIGIHPPTSDLDAVRKKLEKFRAKYPVLIDAPATKPGGLGLLHDWFGHPWWPHTVLINRRGLVAGHGQLWRGNISEQLRRLSTETD